LEGVACGLRDALELLRALDVRIDQVRVSGGGARSSLWRQILADVFATEIVTTNGTPGAGFGDALLAGVGIGVYGSVAEACEQVIRVVAGCRPGSAVGTYGEAYARYRALYPALAAQFRAIDAAAQAD
jgi:xylulokinase